MVSFKGLDIISAKDLSQKDLEFILTQIKGIKKNYSGSSFKRKTINTLNRAASLFFEPSTRTRISSELAASDLGIFTDGFSGIEGTSTKKGEPLKDTLFMFQGYKNKALFMRHPLEGSARYAAEQLKIPVINCGDGANQHPTQTILDLFTIQECQGRLQNLTVSLVGDLKYGRTTHSLLMALGKYGLNVLLVAPEKLQMNKSYVNYFAKNAGFFPQICLDLKEAISRSDIVYMTRIQRERFPEGPDGEQEFKQVSGIYKLTPELIKSAKPKKNMKILHPLPRYKHNLEISLDVDGLPYAHYYQQAENGLYARYTVLALVLGITGKKYEVEGQPKLADFPLKEKLQPTERKVSRQFFTLTDGTLIDHIEKGRAREVMKALGIKSNEYSHTILQLSNITSTKYGRKDVIGISKIYLEPKLLSRLALVSSTATINHIREGRVTEKFRVSVPREISEIVECPNPMCITRPEQFEHVPTKFYNLQIKPSDPLSLVCAYCEKEISREQITIKN